MLAFKSPVYLASKSPRRRKLLSILGFEFESFSVDIEEEFDTNSSPEENVERLALEKLDAALEQIDEGIVITADTIVVLDGKIIGKPENEDDAFMILSALSGKTHTVFTGFAIAEKSTSKKIVACEATQVTFAKMSPEEIWEYISTGSPMDKAGAYGIQDDYGAVFISRIDGCYYNVVGLPLHRLYHELQGMV